MIEAVNPLPCLAIPGTEALSCSRFLSLESSSLLMNLSGN